mmetsp:Transcript_2856/g.4325  ORF Transcript_2856/g.4325 Transcript_2856/m.4325 type:complete len:144 (-) Transcript_2856:639-1070(-)
MTNSKEGYMDLLIELINRTIHKPLLNFFRFLVISSEEIGMIHMRLRGSIKTVFSHIKPLHTVVKLALLNLLNSSRPKNKINLRHPPLLHDIAKHERKQPSLLLRQTVVHALVDTTLYHLPLQVLINNPNHSHKPLRLNLPRQG